MFYLVVGFAKSYLLMLHVIKKSVEPKFLVNEFSLCKAYGSYYVILQKFNGVLHISNM